MATSKNTKVPMVIFPVLFGVLLVTKVSSIFKIEKSHHILKVKFVFSGRRSHVWRLVWCPDASEDGLKQRSTPDFME